MARSIHCVPFSPGFSMESPGHSTSRRFVTSQRNDLACRGVSAEGVDMRVPWYVWTAVASVTCILVGGYWDISWHMTIGRDTFWTPAHLALQLGGIIAGTCGAYVIIATTLGRLAHLRPAPGCVTVWGFRGPLGAFVAVWGAAT